MKKFDKSIVFLDASKTKHYYYYYKMTCVESIQRHYKTLITISIFIILVIVSSILLGVGYTNNDTILQSVGGFILVLTIIIGVIRGCYVAYKYSHPDPVYI
jgi:hypothetical protein